MLNIPAFYQLENISLSSKPCQHTHTNPFLHEAMPKSKLLTIPGLLSFYALRIGYLLKKNFLGTIHTQGHY